MDTWATTRYYVGPFVWSAALDSWEWPRGASHCLDLGRYSDFSGAGKPGEMKPDTRSRDAWESVLGYRPNGETLIDWIQDHRTVGADPLGLDSCMPAMPGTRMKLVFGGMTLLDRAFAWGEPHTEKLLAAKRPGLAALWEAEHSDAADRPKPGATQRALTSLCDEFKVDKASYRQFLPSDLREHVPAPLPHQTVIRDLFNIADTSTIPGWSDSSGDTQVVSQRLRANALVTRCGLRNDTDLSSSNNWAEIMLETHNSTSDADAGGACCRWSSSADTFYSAIVQYLTASSAFVFRLSRVVNGIPSTFATATTGLSSLPCMVKVTAGESGAGDEIRGYMGGVLLLTATDGNIGTGTRLGTRLRTSTSTAHIELSKFLGSDVFYPRRIVNGGLVGCGLINGGLLISC